MKTKWIRNSITLGMCFLTLLVYNRLNNKQQVEKEVVNIINDSLMFAQVVYIDNDDTLIPVSYQINEKNDFNEYVLTVFNLMKGSDIKGLNSIIPIDLSLQSSVLNENGLLSLDFSSALEQINSENELRFLEGMVYVFTQFDEVNNIMFSMNGEPLVTLPSGNISIKATMDQSLGINNFETSEGQLHRTSSVVVYYNKQIGNEEFYVPMSKRVTIDYSLDSKVSEIIGEVSVSSTVSQVSSLNSIELLGNSSLVDGILNLNLNSEALLDEITVNQEVYDLLVLSLSQIDGVNKIQIQVHGIEIPMSQVMDVSNIIYNVVKI